MRKNAKILSLVLSLVMLLALVPQFSVFAVTSAEVNEAFKAAAITGDNYVKGDLPATLTIGGVEYPTTYYVTEGGSNLTGDGKTHNVWAPTHARFIPGIKTESGTVYGSIISVKLLATKYFEEVLFEGFEGSEFAPDAGATTKTLAAGEIGQWKVTDNSNDTLDIQNEDGSRVLKLNHAQYQNAALFQSKKTYAELGVNDGTIKLLTFRAMMDGINSGARLMIMPFGMWKMPNGYGSAAGADTHFGVENTQLNNAPITAGTSKVWSDYALIIYPAGADGVSKVDYYVNGSFVATVTGKLDTYYNNMTLTSEKSFGSQVRIDDIWYGKSKISAAALEAALGKLADKGNSYVTADLPKTATIDGSAFDVTYVTSNAAVIAADGKVGNVVVPTTVTVTPQVKLGDIVLGSGAEVKLTVLPTIAKEKFFEDFEGSEFGATAAGNALADGTYGKWTVGANGGNAYIKAIAGNNKHASDFVEFYIPAGNATEVYMASGDLGLSDDNINIMSFSALISPVSSLSTFCFQPFGMLRVPSVTDTNKSVNYMQTGSSTPVAGVSTFNEWHDYTIVQHPVVDGKTYTEIYVDGVLKGTANEAKNSSKTFWINTMKAWTTYGQLDDIWVGEIDCNYAVTAATVAGSALTEVSVSKVMPSAPAAKVFVAAYSDSQTLVAAKDCGAISFAEGSNVATVTLAEAFNLGTAKTLKIFVWTEGLNPVATVYEKTLY